MDTATERAGWWSDADFWEEMFDFIFPPAQLALGEEAAAGAVALLGLAPPASVVDLGCGPGRVAIPLARMGFRVTGVDAQPAYLDRARAWAEREGVTVDLRREDIAAADLAPEHDAVLCLFNSFGYFADPEQDRRVLVTAAEALRPGGRLVLEVAHRDGVVRTMHPRDAELGDGRRFHEAPRFDPVTGILETRWSVTTAGSTRAFVARTRPYTATELHDLLLGAGFRDLRFHRDLQGAPPSTDSYMVVAVATR